MAIKSLTGLFAMLLLQALAYAQAQSRSASQPDTAPQSQGLSVRPRILKYAQPLYPPEAWDKDVEGDVVLLLWIDEKGKVEAGEVVSTPGYNMEIAALAAAKKLVFSPAEIDGKPVKVKIRYTFKFRKPEKATQALPPQTPTGECPGDRRPKGTLRGTVLQLGTGKPLPGAEVYLLDLDKAVLTDSLGNFESELSPGGYAITINVPRHYPFESLERIGPGEKLEVKYYIEEKRYDKYKTIVWGNEGKAMVGRTTLADAEIYEVPGTIGDPIRVVMLMPGVTTSVSGIGYPVVRGALPGDTRYEMDGVQVPMLYHLMFGNAVVNPRFTTGLIFQPGGYSVEHGQFPGALIMGEPAPEPENPVTAADASIIQSSLFHARPVTEDFKVLGAARYGTLGLIIEGLASNAIFRYWDYQSKIFWNLTEKDKIQLMVFGAGNQVGEERPDGSKDVLEIEFHRLLLRERRTFNSGWFQIGAELGQEGFNAPDESEENEEDEGMPKAGYSYGALRSKASLALTPGLEIHTGTEVYFQDFDFHPPTDDLVVPEEGITLGGYLEAEWTPGSLTLVPGVRIDYYHYGIFDTGPRQTGVDPRLAAGYDITDWLTTKASIGVYQGPSRVTIAEGPIVMGPVPGMMGVGLEQGLSRSIQFANGAEVKLPLRFEAGLQGYYSLLRTALDFSLIGKELETTCDGDPCDIETGEPTEDEEEIPPSSDGRSYGMELMLRRRMGESVFGWMNYSLSRSEREVKDVGVLPFMFDQTHVCNAVVSWEVGRHWTLGSSFHFHSGRPYTPVQGVYCDTPQDTLQAGYWATCRGQPFSRRLPGYWRIDTRIQKREVFKTWYFDFYIDILNLTFNKETIGYEINGNGNVKPVKFFFFVPMLGLRACF